MKFRQKRIGGQIQNEIGKMILTELKDPRIGFASISQVKMAPDLKLARVYISVLGEDKEFKSTLIALNQAKGWIRRELGRRLHLRYTPEIHFHRDDSIAYSAHMDEVFKSLDIGPDAPSEEEGPSESAG